MKDVYKIINLIFLFLIVFTFNLYAGEIIENNDGGFSYITKDNIKATNTWCLIDKNNDNIGEFYHFDENGNLSINYEDEFGKKTNEYGQLIINSEVVRKVLATNKVFFENKDSFGPKIENKEEENNTVLPNTIFTKDIPTQYIRLMENINNKEIFHEDIPDANINEIIDNQVIYYEKPFESTPEANGNENLVIYDKSTAKSVDYNKEGKIIPGKDAINYIIGSNKFIKDEKDIVLYNGSIWDSCVSLGGDKAYIKFNVRDFTNFYFEVSQSATSLYGDIDGQIEIYVDNQLFDTFDDFFNTDPIEIEEEFENAKTLEIRLKINAYNQGKKIYLRHLKLRKVSDD